MKKLTLLIISIYLTVNLLGQAVVNLINPNDLKDYLNKPALDSKVIYSIGLAKEKPSLYRDKIYRNKTCDYLIVVNQTHASNNFYRSS